jgi:hypothetical protein
VQLSRSLSNGSSINSGSSNSHSSSSGGHSSSGDPYALYAQQLVQHSDYALRHEGAASLCRAVAASRACARKATSRTAPEVKAAAYSAAKAGAAWAEVWGFKEPRTAFFLKELDEVRQRVPAATRALGKGERGSWEAKGGDG